MSLASGVSTLQSSFIQENLDCYYALRFTGPYGDAKPEDRFVVGDVRRRLDDAQFKAWTNTIQSLAVHQALEHAGIKNAKVALPKHYSSASSVGVAVGQNGRYPIMGYNNLTTDKAVPNSVAISTAPSLGKNLAGKKLLDLPGGTALVKNDSPQFGLADQYNRNAVPGVTLFSAPRYGGDIANLGVSGGDLIQAIDDGDIMRQMQASGENVFTSQILSSKNAMEPKLSDFAFNPEPSVAANAPPAPAWVQSDVASSSLYATSRGRTRF